MDSNLTIENVINNINISIQWTKNYFNCYSIGYLFGSNAELNRFVLKRIKVKTKNLIDLHVVQWKWTNVDKFKWNLKCVKIKCIFVVFGVWGVEKTFLYGAIHTTIFHFNNHNNWTILNSRPIDEKVIFPTPKKSRCFQFFNKINKWFTPQEIRNIRDKLHVKRKCLFNHVLSYESIFSFRKF